MTPIFLALRTALKAKGVPVEVVYGPTAVPLAVGASRISFGRDYDAGDQMQAGRGRFPIPKMRALVSSGVLVRIHAMSTVAGAQRNDHEDLCDRLVEQVYVEIDKAVQAAKTMWRVTRAAYVVDTSVPDGWQGVTYEMHAQIDQALSDVLWVADTGGTFVMQKTTTHTALDKSSSPAPTTNLPSADTRIS